MHEIIKKKVQSQGGGVQQHSGGAEIKKRNWASAASGRANGPCGSTYTGSGRTGST